MQLSQELGNFNSFQAKPQLSLQLPSTWTPPEQDTKDELESLEASFKSPTSLTKETSMEAYMRAVLVDWLLEICSSLAFSRQTSHLAISYTDKFSFKHPVAQQDLQLVGCACLFIAAKFEEVYTPRLATIAKAAANTFTGQQILDMEQRVLRTLEWKVLPPTLYAWTRYIMRCWDDYILHISPCIFLPFQSKDPDSYQLYIDAMAMLDLLLMDPSHAHFPKPDIVAGVILQAVAASTSSQVSSFELYRCFEYFINRAVSRRSFRHILKVLALVGEFTDLKVKAVIPTPRSKLPIQFEEVFSLQTYSSSVLKKYKAKHLRHRLAI
jgi:hypothetical protein